MVDFPLVTSLSAADKARGDVHLQVSVGGELHNTGANLKISEVYPCICDIYIYS